MHNFKFRVWDEWEKKMVFLEGIFNTTPYWAGLPLLNITLATLGSVFTIQKICNYRNQFIDRLGDAKT